MEAHLERSNVGKIHGSPDGPFGLYASIEFTRVFSMHSSVYRFFIKSCEAPEMVRCDCLGHRDGLCGIRDLRDFAGISTPPRSLGFLRRKNGFFPEYNHGLPGSFPTGQLAVLLPGGLDGDIGRCSARFWVQ